LSYKHELNVGRELGDVPKYYVPRVLQHHIYLKEDILLLTDNAITFAVSGLQADELIKYLPAGEKICEFVYDEKISNHTFKIISDFYKIGLDDENETMKTHQQEGQQMKNNTEFDVSEGSKINSFINVAKHSKSGLSAEVENMKASLEEGKYIEPEDVRYIILGNTNPESEFEELKELCSNVHWIHVQEGSFLWRDTNFNIDIIRRYIDNTKCEEYDLKRVVEHNDRTMLLVAEPGMGKSTFFSYMAHEIKKWKPSVWVLRINLNDYTKELECIEFKRNCIEKCKMFLWNAAHSPEQDPSGVTKIIFLQALEQTGKMVIILDGFDQLSPDLSRKVKKLINAIRNELASKIWISSCLSSRKELENIVGNFAFTLQPFTKENQIEFLEQYWSEVTEISNRGKLQMFAKTLLSLCSQYFSDKDGEFTGIPSQTMVLGEAFVNEAKRYCCGGELNLTERFNLLSLFKRATENKSKIYFRK
jgi:hypothetical protein